MKITTYEFECHGDSRGSLVSLEQFRNIPFKIRRVYYMYGMCPDVRRGCHAHKTLQQILICVHGSCTILLDNGHEQCNVVLKNPTEGLYISNATWREMYDFSEGAVLMVLASELYDETDYIRNYDAFTQYVKENDENRCRIGG